MALKKWLLKNLEKSINKKHRWNIQGFITTDLTIDNFDEEVESVESDSDEIAIMDQSQKILNSLDLTGLYVIKNILINL